MNRITLALLGIGFFLPLANSHGGTAYEVDPASSSVVFKVKHMGVANAWGRFNELSGSIDVDDAAPENTKLEFVVKAASVDTNHKKRDEHLRGPDFFDVKQYPEITFKTTKAEKGDDEGLFKVTGELSLHGVTKTITVPVEYFGTGVHAGTKKDIAGAEATFKIKRSDYDITKYLPGGIGDDVTIIVAIEAVKKAPEPVEEAPAPAAEEKK